MTQLGAGMSQPVTQLPQFSLQVANADTEANRVSLDRAVQSVAEAAHALSACAGALAAAANEVATNSRTAAQRDQAIVQNLGQLTRLVDQCCSMMSTMDMTPTVHVEAAAPVVPPAEVTVLPAQARTKTVTLTDSQGRTVTGTVTEA